MPIKYKQKMFISLLFQMNSLIVGLSLINFIGCVQIEPLGYKIVQQNLPLQSHATYYPDKAAYYNYDTSPARTFLTLGAKSLFGCVISFAICSIRDRFSQFGIIYMNIQSSVLVFASLWIWCSSQNACAMYISQFSFIRFHQSNFKCISSGCWGINS